MAVDRHVDVQGLSKSYGATQALHDVHVTVARGSVHCLVGENGAGKSTLGKIIAGVVQPDAGRVVVNGVPAHYSSPRDALAAGITLIAQEIAVVPQRSVVENMLLGIESSRFGIVDRKDHLRRFRDITERAGFDFPPHQRVGTMRMADQQKVEILRALARNAEFIVMDEPTAALTTDEAGRLLEIVKRLRDAGTTVMYVSHHLDEVLEIADVITTLRNGQVVRTSEPSSETKDSLVTAMLGRRLETTYPPKRPPSRDAGVVVSVDQLTKAPSVLDVSFELRAGEIVGLAGLVGSGRTDLARLLFGADAPDSGHIHLDGKTQKFRSPRDGIGAGVALLPESRKDQGLVMRRSIVDNVTMPRLGAFAHGGAVVDGAAAQAAARSAAESADVRYASLDGPVNTLSGGNQQKVLFAKWMLTKPRFFIADEPTRGVDVGAKLRIHELIAELAAAGMAVLLISSELEEVLGLAHRVLVMRTGRLVAEFAGPTFSEDAVMRAAVLPDQALAS